MRTLRMAAIAALMSGPLLLFTSPPARATVLSVGTANKTFGGYVCADVAGGSFAIPTPANAFDCNAEPNQQFELVPIEFSEPSGTTIAGFTIYAMAGHRCLGVRGGVIAAGTPVESQLCNAGAGQVWMYYGGTIGLAATFVTGQTELCLDATNMANGTQLVVNKCVGFPSVTSQNWQIK